MSKEKKPSFNEVIEWLDSLKQMYYLCKAEREHASPHRAAAAELEKKLVALDELPIYEAMRMLAKDEEFEAQEYTAGKRVSLKTPLGKHFHEVLETDSYTDRKFYHEAGFGEFWNEVALPDFIESLFMSLAEELKKDWPHLLGTEGVADDECKLHDGVIGISYYDLSDIALVFENQDAADEFADANGVEPSDFMEFHDGAWQCF